jgi:hypothetical protein
VERNRREQVNLIFKFIYLRYHFLAISRFTDTQN